MRKYNVVIVYSLDRRGILMCFRSKDPYKGLYNLVGGKIEENEDGLASAYRELLEETGIGGEDIVLTHLMDLVYPHDHCEVKAYVGGINKEITLVEEAHKLCWMDIRGNNYFDMDRFAGEGNIGHMLEIARLEIERGRVKL